MAFTTRLYRKTYFDKLCKSEGIDPQKFYTDSLLNAATNHVFIVTKNADFRNMPKLLNILNELQVAGLNCIDMYTIELSKLLKIKGHLMSLSEDVSDELEEVKYTSTLVMTIITAFKREMASVRLEYIDNLTMYLQYKEYYAKQISEIQSLEGQIKGMAADLNVKEKKIFEVFVNRTSRIPESFFRGFFRNANDPETVKADFSKIMNKCCSVDIDLVETSNGKDAEEMTKIDEMTKMYKRNIEDAKNFEMMISEQGKGILASIVQSLSSKIDEHDKVQLMGKRMRTFMEQSPRTRTALHKSNGAVEISEDKIHQLFDYVQKRQKRRKKIMESNNGKDTEKSLAIKMECDDLVEDLKMIPGVEIRDVKDKSPDDPKE